MNAMLKKFLKLAAAIAISELAGIIGTISTTPAISGWYANLRKPFFGPPNWIFAPVWITLYALMGLAAFLVWRGGLNRSGVKKALLIFLVQLALNSFWTIIFFGLKSPGWALMEIIILWFAVFWTIKEFGKLSRPAAYLLLPYISWITFAAYLNLSVWFLNT